MDVMFEQMNAIVAGKGMGPDKENTLPGGNVNPGSDNDTGTTKCKNRNAPIAERLCSTRRRNVMSLKPTPANSGQDGSRSRIRERRRNDRDRGRRIIVV
jgi:hypothetical protein